MISALRIMDFQIGTVCCLYVALWNVRVVSEYPDEARDLQQPSAGDNLLKAETPKGVEENCVNFHQSSY